jgi:poly(A) polymerase
VSPMQKIPREEHGISRKSISPAALKVLYTLKDGGFAAYLVGGALRDVLSGVEPKDFDIATNATPDQVRALFRNCRLIGRRFVIAHVRIAGEIIEVTTFRGSGTEDSDESARHVGEDGRITRDNVFGSIEEDALRRDFTANALYYAIEDFALYDFVDSVADIKARILRLIGDPVTRYREDPVRMLRGARLKAKLGFELAPETASPIKELAPLLHDIPAARLFDEACKLFLTGHGLASMRELSKLGLLNTLFPALARFATQQAGKHGALEIVRVALNSTDERLRAGKTVTPGFLFAAMGWPLFTAELERSKNVEFAINAAITGLCERVAIPRRFTTMMADIWSTQERLLRTSPSRARRLVAHPRFRAAYDFLLVRAAAVGDNGLQATAEKWTAAQLPGADFDALFAAPSKPR